MSEQASARFNAIRARLDALKEGQVPPAGVVARARALFANPPREVKLTEIVALDQALDHAGIHTSADAKLLHALSSLKGRLAKLKSGLAARASTALDEFEASLTSAEHYASMGQRDASIVTELDVQFPKLARVVKVAAVFSAGEAGGQSPFEVYVRSAGGRQAPVSARVAVVEFLADRARQNVNDVARKRGDLDLAHELLLRMGAASKNDRDRVRRARIDVSAARDRVMATPQVSSLQDLSRHVRHSARRDARTAYRSLRALYDRAVEANDTELASAASSAVQALLSETKNASELVQRAEGQRILAWRENMTATGELAAGRLKPGGRAGVDDSVADELTQLAFGLDDDRIKALELAAGASRLFDVEEALTENFVQAEMTSSRPVQRRVTYPTQLMTYEFAQGLDEIHNFVVTQPGSIILDLAAGRQVVRQYLEEEAPPKPKRMKKTAVRVYVLDASGSMHGPRARFRDAILIAELNAIRVKGKLGLPFDPLYFCYFNDTPTELNRVDSASDAAKHIEALFQQSPAEGQTDISLALMAAFESIGNAQGKDPYLSRATVVLVTDGEDGVDLETIRRTKKPFEGLDIALSFISLGEENTDLRTLVTEQRASGGRAFYHHLSDAEIGLVRTDFDSAWRTLLPPDIDLTGDVLERLMPHLEALDAIAANRTSGTSSAASSVDQFDTLFPATPEPARANPQIITRIVDVYEAIAETAGLTPVENRAGEAVILLNHLLGLYGVSLPKYLEAVGAGDPALIDGRTRIRLLCRPFD